MDTEKMIRELRRVYGAHKNDFVPTGQTNIANMCMYIIPKLEKLMDYEEIGTVSEFRDFAGKQIAVKPILQQPSNPDGILEYHCSICDSFVCHALNITHTEANKTNYCTVCGNKIDWS